MSNLTSLRLHAKAQKLATTWYLRRGYVPQILREILAATAPINPRSKYSPDQPRVPVGNPDGGRWTREDDNDAADYPTSAVKTRADADKIVKEAKGKHIGKNSACASLTHKLAPQLPGTPQWKPGYKVQGNQKIPVGTPIATFNYAGQRGTNGYGPAYSQVGLSGHSHTGIYLGQDKDGLLILHQHPKIAGPEVKLIPWNIWGRRNTEEAGSHYYTISY